VSGGDGDALFASLERMRQRSTARAPDSELPADWRALAERVRARPGALEERLLERLGELVAPPPDDPDGPTFFDWLFDRWTCGAVLDACEPRALLALIGRARREHFAWLGLAQHNLLPIAAELVERGGDAFDVHGLGSRDFVVRHPELGELRGSNVAPLLIERACFFEGSVPYRIEPAHAARVLGLHPEVRSTAAD
jgi:hypothetical protein